MLAALLLNLTAAPTPPPVAAPARFGGGPFWRRTWRLDDDEEEREELEEVVKAIEPSPVAAKAVERAAQAIRSLDIPDRVVIEAGEVYARAMRALDADLDATRIERQWEREVRRRLREAERQEQEDEEIMMVMLAVH